jgi:3-hydroxy-9,10-secoandrosta-1,3,5(10)-triene-9,17-dione monooxygenase
MELKTELRAKATMAGKLSAEAVDLLFQLSGGAGLYDKNPISRAMRDMNCIRGHITQNWDVNASNHGRVLMGLPSADPAL